MNENTTGPLDGWAPRDRMLAAPQSPEPFAPPPPAAPYAPPASDGRPSQDDRVLAAVSHGSTFFEGGVLAPLVIYFVKRESSPFVAFHALQSLLFGVLFFALTFLTCGVGAVILVWPYLIFEGIATLKSYEGEWYELPVVGAYCRRHVTGQC